MKRRSWLAAAAAAPWMAAWRPAAAQAAPAGASAPATPQAERVLRYAFSVAETGFDPTKINDLYSRIITAHIFEAPYGYDYLARPFKMRPVTAEDMPEVTDDFKTWTIRLRPGIYFDDDPAFKGVRRELVAQDYVYTWKRFFDPANKSPTYAGFAEEGVIGVDALRQQALSTGRAFDYDREVEGLRALDRYTLQFRLASSRPRFLYTIADSSLFGAIAREVVEFYGERIAEHPVGTGPFRLSTWRRSSHLGFERNPTYRPVYYDGEPAADDVQGQALLARFKGRRLPMVDRVEIAIIEQSQPRWLSFLNREFDLVTVPLEFMTQALAGDRLAPHLEKRGVTMERIVNADVTLFYFNMEDPIVGGYTPEKVALRRAISLAYDVQREILQVRRGQAIPAQSMVEPGTWGYDPNYKSENSDYSLPRAKALLDMYGYLDRDGDGWRELPDGSPLVLDYATEPDSISRQFDEVWKKCMDDVGIRLRFKTAKWPEQLKAARSGQLMVWQLGYTSAAPDVQDGLQTLYGPASGGQNLARFKFPRFDEIYDRMKVLPDGPERLSLLHEAMNIVTAYAPQKFNVHRIVTDLSQPWLAGFRRPLFSRQFWQYVDIDESRRGM